MSVPSSTSHLRHRSRSSSHHNVPSPSSASPSSSDTPLSNDTLNNNDSNNSNNSNNNNKHHHHHEYHPRRPTPQPLLEDTRVLKDQASFEGFVNLGMVLLAAATAQLMLLNYLAHGFVVDFSLLLCMVSRSYLAAVLYVGTLLAGLLVYGVWRITAAVNTTGMWLIAVGVYTVVQASLIGGTTWLILHYNVAPIVATVLAVIIMIFTMKLHSFFAVVSEDFHAVSSPLHSSSSSSSSPQKHQSNTTAKTPSLSSLLSTSPPHPVSLSHFVYFLFAPTLVFEFSYERTQRIRWLYAVRQLLQCGICGCMVYILTSQYLVPVLHDAPFHTHPADILIDLMRMSIPWFIVWLLASYAVFHCYLNAVAEVTRYRDRLWYKDWWNAESFDVFWRKWNMPVHEWMLKHVYFSGLQHNLSKPAAVWTTFIISAVMHEMVMSLVFRTIRPWFFLGMASQIPFLFLSRYFQHTKRVGNVLMWGALFTGQPLLLLLYFREWFTTEDNIFCMTTQ